MSIQIDVSADTSQAEEKLAKVQRAFERPVFLRLVGERFLAWVNENFEKGGVETPWAPITDNTRAGRRTGAGRGSPQPLRDTGRLAQSFVYREFPSEVWVGTRDEKAEWAHLGTEPHAILPKNKKALAFFAAAAVRISDRAILYRSRKTGRLITTRRKGDRVVVRGVWHPGTPPRPLLPSKDLARRLAQGVLEAYVEAVSQGQEPASGQG